MARPRKNEGIRYLIFLKTNKSGEKVYHIRFIDQDGVIFAIRSAHSDSKERAHFMAGRIMAKEDLKILALAKRAQKTTDEQEAQRLECELKAAQGTEANRIASMTASEALRLFWDPERSPYLQDLQDAGRPLSSHYLSENTKNIKRYFSKFPAFNYVKMRDVDFAMIDDFLRQMRKICSRFVIDGIINTLRAPITWLAARGAMNPVSFKGITLPEKKPRERGLLTISELERIIGLETAPMWYTEETRIPRIDTKPRPRLKGKDKNEGDPPAIGFREKLAILLGALTGARLGEIRALRWQDVDIESGIIEINHTFSDEDGFLKDPKARSKRKVVISQTLEQYLIEARKIAQELGAASPENFVLYNPSSPEKPISATTISRGWDRILRSIGITEAQQKERNLVYHGLRHLYATRLVDAGLNPNEAAKLTGHRVLATLGRYSDHVQNETLQKAKEILDEKLHGRK